MRIAAFSGSLYTDKEEGLPHLESCACVSFFVFAHIHWMVFG